MREREIKRISANNSQTLRCCCENSNRCSHRWRRLAADRSLASSLNILRHLGCYSRSSIQAGSLQPRLARHSDHSDRHCRPRGCCIHCRDCCKHRLAADCWSHCSHCSHYWVRCIPIEIPIRIHSHQHRSNHYQGRPNHSSHQCQRCSRDSDSPALLMDIPNHYCIRSIHRVLGLDLRKMQVKIRQISIRSQSMKKLILNYFLANLLASNMPMVSTIHHFRSHQSLPNIQCRGCHVSRSFCLHRFSDFRHAPKLQPTPQLTKSMHKFKQRTTQQKLIENPHSQSSNKQNNCVGKTLNHHWNHLTTRSSHLQSISLWILICATNKQQDKIQF